MISGYVESFERLKEAAFKLGRAISETVTAAWETAQTMIEAIRQEIRALEWAKNNHPEWVAIYKRTKKARIRKKYYDRIMRGYAAEIEKEVHTHE